MTKNIRDLFKNLKEHSPSRELKTNILKAINIQEKKSIRAKIILTYAGFTASLAIFSYAIFTFGQAFLQSEFWSLLSLSVTDAGTVMKYWGDFAFSLLETFPVMIAIIFLIPVFLMFISLASYFRLNNNQIKHVI